MDTKRKQYLDEYKKKTKRVSITLSLQEYRTLEAQAKKFGLKPTTFLKQKCFNSFDDKRFLSTQQQEDLKEFVRLIRSIANNVNQMAKHSNIFSAILNKKSVMQNLEFMEKKVIEFVTRDKS